MTKKELFEKIELETRIKYKTKTELAEKVGISRSSLNAILKKIENEENFNYDNVTRILDALGLELVIQIKKEV